MIKKVIIVFSLVLLVCANGAYAKPEIQPSFGSSTYLLNVGDRISVSIYGEEEMSLKETLLSDAGTISLPFLSEFKVSGMSVGRLQKYIEGQLEGDYLIEPNVTVRIIEYRKFFVRGQVRSPGAFSFEPGLTLGKAIAMAGGFTERASKKSVEVIRENTENNRSISTSTKNAHKLSLKERLLPGDTINVKESFF